MDTKIAEREKSNQNTTGVTYVRKTPLPNTESFISVDAEREVFPELPLICI